jgi:DNA-binding transcriptional ArsR family regulator
MWAMDEKNLSKHYGLSKAKLEKWAKPTKRHDAVELERQSREVAEYVGSKVNELYSIEVEKKISVLERIKMAKEVA